jgi:hypothetical protein
MPSCMRQHLTYLPFTPTLSHSFKESDQQATRPTNPEARDPASTLPISGPVIDGGLDANRLLADINKGDSSTWSWHAPLDRTPTPVNYPLLASFLYVSLVALCEVSEQPPVSHMHRIEIEAYRKG